MSRKLKSFFLAVAVLSAYICAIAVLPLSAESGKERVSREKTSEQLATPFQIQSQPQAEFQSLPQVAVPPLQVQPQSPVVPSQIQVQSQPQPDTALPQPPLMQPTAKKGDVSFNFDDADLFSVIQTIFGDILKVNYIVDPRVKGRVNFRSVAPVTKEEVLPLMQVILRLNGVGIVEDSGLYRLVPIGDISREPAPMGIGRTPEEIQIVGKALLQVVSVEFMQSSELVRILTPFLSTNAVIVDVPRSNHIIIMDTDANVQRLLRLVGIFDSEMTKNASPKVFVYPIQNSKAKDIAALLQQIFLGAKALAKVKSTAKPAAPTPQPGGGFTVSSQPQAATGLVDSEPLVSDITRIFPDDVTNSVIILAMPEDYVIISETIKKIDIVSRQVVIEALLVRVDLTDNLSFGLSWSLNTDLNITNIKPFNNNVNLAGGMTNLPGGMPLDSSAGTGFTFVGSDPTGVVRARLSAALKDSRAKILASPHILVSDNREAKIQVGSQVPIATSTTSTPLSTTTTTTTNTTTSTIQYKDIGIILKVKPQVNDSGLVFLEIDQEVSSLGDAVKIAGQDYQAINKTQATTNLVAHDGETIIIGGLIREDITKSKDGIPLLSKIPLLGSLFSSTTDNSTRTELIILLTPHVVKNQREAQEVTTEYIKKLKGQTKDNVEELIRKRELKKEGSREAVGAPR